MHAKKAKMLFSTLATLPVLALFALGAPAHLSEPAVKHAWSQIPDGWEIHGTPAADHPITLKIGLKQSRIDNLIATLYNVSDPFHPDYGQHLSRLCVFEVSLLFCAVQLICFSER